MKLPENHLSPSCLYALWFSTPRSGLTRQVHGAHLWSHSPKRFTLSESFRPCQQSIEKKPKCGRSLSLSNQAFCLVNKSGPRYKGLSDNWDSVLPASLFSGSLSCLIRNGGISKGPPLWSPLVWSEIWKMRLHGTAFCIFCLTNPHKWYVPTSNETFSPFLPKKNRSTAWSTKWNLLTLAPPQQQCSEVCRFRPRSAANVLMESDWEQKRIDVKTKLNPLVPSVRSWFQHFLQFIQATGIPTPTLTAVFSAFSFRGLVLRLRLRNPFHFISLPGFHVAT